MAQDVDQWFARRIASATEFHRFHVGTCRGRPTHWKEVQRVLIRGAPEHARGKFARFTRCVKLDEGTMNRRLKSHPLLSSDDGGESPLDDQWIQQHYAKRDASVG